MKLSNFPFSRLETLRDKLLTLSNILYNKLSIEEWQEEYWDRKIGLMLERNLETDDYTADIERIATVFNNKYGDALQHIYDVLHKEYEPLYNTDATTDITSTDTYDTKNNMTENSEVNTTGNTTNNSTFSGTNGNTRTDNRTESDTNSRTYTDNATDNATNTMKNSGYNSDDLTITSQSILSDTKVTQGNSSDTGNATIEDTIVDSGTIANTTNGTSALTNNVDSNVDRETTDTGTVTHETLLRRYGNVGVTTAQKCVTDEVLLRIQLNYLDILFKMLAEMLLDKIWEVE